MQRNLASTLRRLSSAIRSKPFLLNKRTFQAPTIPVLQQCGGQGKLTPKLKNLMRQFQKQNDKPIFLKGGTKDVILYRLTLILCLIGLVGNIHLYFGYILA